MGSNPPFDPRLNCAAEICCSAVATIDNQTETASAQDKPELCASERAQIAILCDAGVSDEHAPKIAARLRAMGVGFTSRALNAAIRDIFEARDATYAEDVNE